MSDNAIILKDFDTDGKYYLSKPKDTDLVLFSFQGSVFDRVRIISEHGFIYYSMVSLRDLLGGTTLVRRSCFETLDGIIPYDKEDYRYKTYYLVTYAEFTKLTPQEFHIFMSENRGYSMNEIMDQIDIRRKELLPELFG